MLNFYYPSNPHLVYGLYGIANAYIALDGVYSCDKFFPYFSPIILYFGMTVVWLKCFVKKLPASLVNFFPLRLDILPWVVNIEFHTWPLLMWSYCSFHFLLLDPLRLLSLDPLVPLFFWWIFTYFSNPFGVVYFFFSFHRSERYWLLCDSSLKLMLIWYFSQDFFY